MENTFLDQVHGKLIISCQALEGEPLHSSFIMARMARAAKMAGAPAIRANSVVDIQAIQDETGLPIIGIIKKIIQILTYILLQLLKKCVKLLLLELKLLLAK